MAEVEANHREIVGWFNLHDCFTGCSGGDVCKQIIKNRPIPIMNYQHWPRCPISLIKTPQWQAVTRLYNAKQVSPLHGWPHKFAAWIVDAMCELEAAFNRKQVADMKQATKGAQNGRR